MVNVGINDDLKGGIFSAFKRNPVLYLDIKTHEAVVLQQETIAALRARKPGKKFLLDRENRKNLEEAKQVLKEEHGRYQRMPRVRMPEIRTWIEEFSESFSDTETSSLLRRTARESRTVKDFTTALSLNPSLLEEWMGFKAQKTIQGFVVWVNSGAQPTMLSWK